MNYYSEFDPAAAAWLRELIAAGEIPSGDVDERDIRDVGPEDLRGYRQCHFFAGIGGWPLALRLAGWPEDRPVWTGSCPCQPFSAAGKRAGLADERHLWPHWFHLIEQCRPTNIFGEQVASALEWFDLVSDDLEGAGYTIGASDLCAAGVGAPHIRQRLFFGAYDLRPSARGLEHTPSDGREERRAEPSGRSIAGGCGSGGLADDDCSGRVEGQRDYPTQRHGNTSSATCITNRHGDPRPTDGLWRDADWLFSRDDRWRPVEPGTFPLADGVPDRVGLLRGYGNAIVPQVAAEFVQAFEEARVMPSGPPRDLLAIMEAAE